MKWYLVAVLSCLAMSARAEEGTCTDASTGKSVTVAKAAFPALRALCEAGQCPDACIRLTQHATTPEATEAQVGPRIFLAALLTRCQAGRLEACREAGSRLFDGRFTMRQRSAGCALWGQACRDGDGPSCAWEGLCFLQGVDRVASSSEAMTRFEAGCAADDGRSCMLVGALTASSVTSPGAGSQGDEADPANRKRRALAMADKSCALGYPDGCASAGAMKSDGGDKAKARVDLDKACKLGSAMGCFFSGRLLAAGEGGARDDTKALAHFERGCELESKECCAEAARRWRDGVGAKTDPIRSLTRFDEACELGAGSACLQVLKELVRTQSRDVERMQRVVRRGCELEDAEACDLQKQFCEAGLMTCE